MPECVPFFTLVESNFGMSLCSWFLLLLVTFFTFINDIFCCSLKCQIHNKIIFCYFTVSIVVCPGMRVPELLQPVLSFINNMTVALTGVLWEEEFIRQERDRKLDEWSRLHWKIPKDNVFFILVSWNHQKIQSSRATIFF